MRSASAAVTRPPTLSRDYTRKKAVPCASCFSRSAEGTVPRAWLSLIRPADETIAHVVLQGPGGVLASSCLLGKQMRRKLFLQQGD